MKSYVSLSADDFLRVGTETVVGRLTTAAAAAGFHQQLHSQTDAWAEQITTLRDALESLRGVREIDAWRVVLEFPIPRRAKRVDAVLLAEGLVLVLEFKCGAAEYAADAVRQVEDYALDLRDFHKGSRGRTVVPFLVATRARAAAPPADDAEDPVKRVWPACASDLAAKIGHCLDVYTTPLPSPFDARSWADAEYHPTPTIIEAAQSLYAGQNVREISRCHGGVENLTRTSDAVVAAVASARAAGRKLICFITGVPGAGKTLAGLNIVHNHAAGESDLGVFLTGNVPLVSVLTEALSRDRAARAGVRKESAKREVSTFIQNVHRFIDAYYNQPEKVPPDRVAVFDEAQRAWDAEQSGRKFNRHRSEPEIILDVMDRHRDWAVIVALVGSGQEINRGEAGISEWGRALLAGFGHWSVLVAPDLKLSAGGTFAGLFPSPPDRLDVREDPALHLSVSLRSYRAEALSEFVECLLRLRPDRAAAIKAERLADYPLVITRDLRAARGWLRARQRGLRRVGLVASSGARRLRAHGLDVTAELDVENWFLNPPGDVRSSHALEVPATEFGIQGLELDWTGVCWGGDLSPSAAGWVCRSFRGTAWQNVRDESRRRYAVNKYRVLLTRAREGMVVWVPPGDEADPTRPPDVYDATARYLRECGIALIDESLSGVKA